MMRCVCKLQILNILMVSFMVQRRFPLLVSKNTFPFTSIELEAILVKLSDTACKFCNDLLCTHVKTTIQKVDIVAL